MPKLAVITTSTRPGRVGPKVSAWFSEQARQHGAFEVVDVDLADVGLPLYDEPNHPRLRKYVHAHTQRWSALIDAADAVVFVVPEYNHAAPPTLINALDFLFTEWAYKPAGFVSYGGVSGGLRSVQSVKAMLTSLKMMPVPEAVTVPMVTKSIGPDGLFTAAQPVADSAKGLLEELARWEGALRGLRRPT